MVVNSAPYLACSALLERIGSTSPAVMSTPTRLITNDSTSSTTTYKNTHTTHDT